MKPGLSTGHHQPSWIPKAYCLGTTQCGQNLDLFFGIFPISGRHIFSTSSDLVLLLSVSLVSFCITSLHLSFGLSICQCPPTSIFHVLITTTSSVFLSTCPPTSIFHVLITTTSSGFLSTCPPTSIFHVLITTTSSVFLSTCPIYLSFASLMFSPIFVTPALALIWSYLGPIV